MKKILTIVLFSVTGLLFSKGIVINEIMSSNGTTIYDEDGDAPDWIELYNTGEAGVNLEGYYLSDDSLEIKKWRFGTAVVAPGEYMIVFASDKDTMMHYWHTNFKISASGESIILSDSSGAVVDQVYVPASLPDVSYGRTGDGGFPWIFQTPSPGEMNTGNEIQDFSETVAVSVPGGFYSSAVTIELSAGAGDIYYTLDGSDPDSGSFKYAGPFTISETTVLRAISMEENHQPSPSVYHTYFINVETDLPVISLISDPYNLFDYNHGIYANGPGWTPAPPNLGANFWMDWERPAHVQFFDDDRNPGFSEDCGIEIYGGYTRSFPQKSISVKFKDPYNSYSLEYPLFPGFEVTTFKSFVLRNSGNDFQYTHIRDAMMQSLVKDLDMDYLEYRPAAAYINGQYWGIYNIREKISEHYVANRHGVDPDNIDMIERNFMVLHGDNVHYGQLVDYIANQDMTTDEAYDFVNRMIDLDNCLLYFAAQVYYNSQDWPANNIKYWRERSGDGKWRWILFDLDFGFNLYETNGQAEDHVYYLFSGVETRPGSNPPWSTLLPRKLMENPVIRNKYINLVADLLNTKFKSERVTGIINDMADHIANEAVKHREHWGISQFVASSHIQRMISFAMERPAYLRGFMRDFFDCGNDGELVLNVTKGGRIILNSLSIGKDDTPWTGTYFQGNPVTVKAVAKYGYKFDGWTGDVTSSEDSMIVSVTSETSLKACFSLDTSVVKEIVINEINYNSADDFDSGDWVELYNQSDWPVNIGGWYFSDSDNDHQFFFPAGTVLEPDNYLVIIDNDSAFTSRFPEIGNHIGETGFGLSGSGEFIKLVGGGGQVIDSLTYDDKSPWPEEADGDGATLELSDPGSDNSRAENWRASQGHGTPGRQNSCITSVNRHAGQRTPGDFTLCQNYPNPFNPTTTITYSIPAPGRVSLVVYDLLGREIATLFKGDRQPGTYSETFDGSGLSTGIYLYRLQADRYSDTKKFLLTR